MKSLRNHPAGFPRETLARGTVSKTLRLYGQHCPTQLPLCPRIYPPRKQLLSACSLQRCSSGFTASFSSPEKAFPKMFGFLFCSQIWVWQAWPKKLPEQCWRQQWVVLTQLFPFLLSPTLSHLTPMYFLKSRPGELSYGKLICLASPRMVKVQLGLR